MLPSIIVIISLYVVFRCVETLCKAGSYFRGSAAYLFTAVAAVGCLLLTCLIAAETISSASTASDALKMIR